MVLVGGVGFSRAGQDDGRRPAQGASAAPKAAPTVHPIRGRVVDASGRSVKGARVLVGPSAWEQALPAAVTDERGAFLLERCDEGNTVVTVQAEGFAPQIREVKVDARTPSLDFRLEPGSVLRVRVVDVARKPVAGAFVIADGWRGYRSLDQRGKTDADGRFAWRGAPGDAVLYAFGKEGFQGQHQVPLIAGDREHVIAPRPSLVVGGRVTDADTGRPLPDCVAIQGFDSGAPGKVYWSRRSAAKVKDGAYSITFDASDRTVYVRVEAIGYEPGISRGLSTDAGPQRIDFALRRAEVLGGLVRGPDGKPAGGVEVALVEPDDEVVMTGGRFTVQMTAPIVRTGADGRFAFNQPEGAFLLIAMGDAGYADATAGDLERSKELALRPWGRIEGRIVVGGRPRAGEEVSFSPDRPPAMQGNARFRTLMNQYTATTDDRGRFRLDRVVPGPGMFSRIAVTKLGRLTQHMTVGNRGVEVKPGEATTVDMVEQGRSVIGRVVLEGTPEHPVDWTNNPPAGLSPTDGGAGGQHPTSTAKAGSGSRAWPGGPTRSTWGSTRPTSTRTISTPGVGWAWPKLDYLACRRPIRRAPRSTSAT